MGANSTRWKFYDPALLWLFPAAYVLHFVEELIATAPVLLWGARLDRPLDVAVFAALSAVALVLMIVGVRLVRRGSRFHWIVPALATAFLLNSAGHVIGSVVAARYSAGMATAIIFWVPLALLTLLRVAMQGSAKTLWGGMCVGVVVEATVLLAMRAMA